MSVPLKYRIASKNPTAHIYEVTLTVASPAAGGQIFAMPAWTPGSYMIRDYSKHVVSIRAESDGLALTLTKLDKSRWQAAASDRPVTIVAEIFAYDESVRGAHLDTTHAYFNGPCVFFCVSGQEDASCELEIVPPEKPVGEEWRVATSMRRKQAEPYGFGVYEADNYDELIDHPVEIGALSIGEFEVNGIPHAIAIRGKTRTDMARLCHDLQTLCATHMSMLGVPDDFDRYIFLLHSPGRGYGGIEHRWSSSLVCARDHLPRRGDAGVSDEYRTFLGLASHEYFHSWNVKRMKPAEFTPFNLQSESHTGLLWVFEGITSYYDDLVLLRSGLIAEGSYLELLGRTITRVLRTGGRHRQSVQESSYDAWTKLYKQDANATNAIISYYTKGALIALCIDLKLRDETDGRTSLDDVMKECWLRWGQSGSGMPEDGFEAVCAEVAGLDLSDFFDAAVRGTGELPLPQLLTRHGISHTLRQSSGESDKGGKAAKDSEQSSLWIGATLTMINDKAVFSVVINDGPAEQAGVAPGDVAVALDGLALTTSNWRRRLGTYHDGDTLDLVVFRGDELISTEIRLETAPTDTCYLEVVKGADDKTQSRRAAWLQA